MEPDCRLRRWWKGRSFSQQPGKPHIHLYSSQRHVNVNLQPCRVCQQQHSHVLTVCISYHFLIFAEDPRCFFSLWAVTLLSRCCHAVATLLPRCHAVATLLPEGVPVSSGVRAGNLAWDDWIVGIGIEQWSFFCVRQTWSGEKRWKRLKLLQNRHDDI